MASTGSTAALFAFFVIASTCVGLSGVNATLEDGRPRRANLPDLPTVTYDNTPVVTGSDGSPVDCIWYGFANELFNETITSMCLVVMRKAFLNETVNPPSSMQPYTYYTIKRAIDPDTNEAYCYQGCFNLGGDVSAVAPSPGVDVGTPPLEDPAAPPLDGPAAPPFDDPAAPPFDDPAAPPLDGAAPPVDGVAPLPSTFSPAPEVLPASPPAPVDGLLPPASDVTAPPGSEVPPEASATAPPSSSLPSAEPSASPPAPPTGPVNIVPDAGTYEQPTALFTLLMTVVVLFFNVAA